MNSALGLLVLTAGQIPVSVGTADWNVVPSMQPRGIPSGIDANEAFRSIVRGKGCDLKGASEVDFKKVRVRYAALLEPNGKADRLLVEDVGCRPLETLVGALALKLITKVDPPGGSEAAWYQAAVRFDGER